MTILFEILQSKILTNIFNICVLLPFFCVCFQDNDDLLALNEKNFWLFHYYWVLNTKIEKSKILLSIQRWFLTLSGTNFWSFFLLSWIWAFLLFSMVFVLRFLNNLIHFCVFRVKCETDDTLCDVDHWLFTTKIMEFDKLFEIYLVLTCYLLIAWIYSNFVLVDISEGKTNYNVLILGT